MDSSIPNNDGGRENDADGSVIQPPFGHRSDSRQSSLSVDLEEEEEEEEGIRVLGAPLSDRSSDELSEKKPKILVDEEGRNVMEEEEDSLRDFEEQEREVARQLAIEQEKVEKEEGVDEEREGELMEDILEENEDEEEQMGKEEMEMDEDEDEDDQQNDYGPQVQGLWRVEADELPRSSQSRVSESLQNREFNGAEILHDDPELRQQRLSSADSGAANSVAGYPLDYPTDPPPAYSSPRAQSRGHLLFERPTTSSNFGKMMMEKQSENEENGEEEGERMAQIQPGYAVPSSRFESPEEEVEEDSELEEEEGGNEGNGKIRAVIGSSFALAGGMAAAVAATARIGAENEPKQQPQQMTVRQLEQPQIGQSPRRVGSMKSPRMLVQGARTAADLVGKKEATKRGGVGVDLARSLARKDRKMEEMEGATQQRYPVNAELKALFKQIEDYVAERVEIEPVFRPFQIDYIPAVGDVDPLIKVPRPDENDELQLGLCVLDEPAAVQSDPAIVDLRLHQMAGKMGAADMPVKKLSRADKNAHQIDRWIQSVRELRRTKPPDRINYSRAMPSIETLMQEWPQSIEQQLKGMKILLTSNLDVALEDYVDICLAIADIPMHKSRLEALHLFFSLYAEFQNSQHFRNLALGQREGEERGETAQTMVDNFVIMDEGGMAQIQQSNRLEIG